MTKPKPLPKAERLKAIVARWENEAIPDPVTGYPDFEPKSLTPAQWIRSGGLPHELGETTEAIDADLEELFPGMKDDPELQQVNLAYYGVEDPATVIRALDAAFVAVGKGERVDPKVIQQGFQVLSVYVGESKKVFGEFKGKAAAPLDDITSDIKASRKRTGDASAPITPADYMEHRADNYHLAGKIQDAAKPAYHCMKLVVDLAMELNIGLPMHRDGRLPGH